MIYLIIGNGVAGVEAAQTIRKNDPDGEISIISSSKNLHYYRPKLIDYLSGEATIEKITIFKPEFYEKKNISNILNTTITSIDPEKKVVCDTNKKSYPYDKLLIATGGKPFVPPIKGVERKGVFTLRGITDAEKILKYSEKSENIIIIGGGLLGLETASSLYRPGKKITVIEFAEWLLPRQLDKDGGEILKSLLVKKGINFITGDSVASIEGNGESVENIILNSGKKIQAETTVISAGIRSNLDLAEGPGLKVKMGIQVDDLMQTSEKEIYAAGDTVEHNGRCYGLWLASKEQGNIAGLNMSGNRTEYKGSVVSSHLKVTGIDLYSAGEIDSTEGESFVLKDDTSYKKLLMKGEKPSGIIALGDKDASKMAQKVMQGKADPEEFKKLF